MVRLDVVVSIIGVLVAFPMKRRFINDEQLPFPEGRACGVVLDALYTGAAHAGMFKARLLAVTAALTAVYQAVDQRRLDDAPAVQDPAPGPVGRHEGAVDSSTSGSTPTTTPGATKAHWLDPDDPRHRHPPARPAPDARCRDAGRRRPDGHRGGDELPARRVHQLRDPRADHDPGRRHRRRASARPARWSPISRAEIVNQWSLWWGVDDDGRRLAGQPAGTAGDLQGAASSASEKPRQGTGCAEAHRVSAVDLAASACPLSACSALGDARVLRRARGCSPSSRCR